MSSNQLTASIAENDYGEKVIKIAFPYDFDLLAKIRSLPGRKWYPELKVWSTPIHEETLKSLIDWGFELDDSLFAYINKVSHTRTNLVETGVNGLKGIPYPFQNVGVAHIEINKGRALIADEMGLGKTITAIAWLQLHPELRPAIIICPAFLKLNWEREINKWMPNPNTCILKGTKTHTTREDIIIINYDILYNWYPVLRKRNPKVLITDECHYYKSNNAKRTKAVKMLSKDIPNIIALSGTPIENRPIEIFNAISIINPKLFPNRWHFLQRYCNATYTGFGWDFSGASHMPELHHILSSTIMIRRKKADVLKDLPDKVRSFIPIELDNGKEYTTAEKDFISWVRKIKGNAAAEKASNAKTFSSIEALKQLAVKGKLKQVKEWISDFLESGKKLVVFATHHFVIDELTKEFGNISVHVDGRVSLSIRQKAVDLFQNSKEVQLFIGNIDAAGIGITLTAASDVAFLELPWTPGRLSQAEDRCHRIGQKESVNIYYLLANGTIEEKIAKLIDNKRKVLDQVLDGEITDEASLIHELMNEYK
jgi:SWI/SNF-related matrix-associated actin-dependent regulator 1 of chromatin subfamily A